MAEPVPADPDGAPGPELAVELVSRDGTARSIDADPRFTLRLAWGAAPDGVAEEGLVSIAYAGEAPIEAGLRLSIELSTVATPPTWLIPGLFYGENRLPACRGMSLRYERGANDPHFVERRDDDDRRVGRGLPEPDDTVESVDIRQVEVE